jgi:predicted dehydrogenase
MKYSVLLIGLGRMGMGYDLEKRSNACLTHANAFSKNAGFELVGAVDLDPKLREIFINTYGGFCSQSLSEAVAALKPDVVVIASTTQTHAATLFDLLKLHSPKLILCEKPLSYHLSDAKKMVDLCAQKEVKLFVNYPRRVDNAVREIGVRLGLGEIEPPYRGVVWYSKGLLHNGSHFLDLMNFWFGEPDSFSIISNGRAFGEDDVEPDFSVTYKYGEFLFLAAKEEHFSHHEIQVIAANGCLRYEYGGRKVSWQSVIADPLVDGYLLLSSTSEVLPSSSDQIMKFVADEMLLALSGKATSLCTGSEALENFEFINSVKNLCLEGLQ